ncbi:hypothetical protein NEPAR08_1801 [Nematocida parisii]|nr:hypothetical protein NEPAR03_1822 [Nematocida parisii]KAI5129982.1 hypothetical protein NEPAR08_1801 [Nematocida parisii]
MHNNNTNTNTNSTTNTNSNSNNNTNTYSGSSTNPHTDMHSCHMTGKDHKSCDHSDKKCTKSDMCPTEYCKNGIANTQLSSKGQMNYKMCLPTGISPEDVIVKEEKKGNNGEIKICYKKESKIDRNDFKQCCQQEGGICFTIDPNRKIKCARIENGMLEIDLEEGEPSNKEITLSLPDKKE